MSSFRILGPIEVWAGDRRLELRGARQVALLGFLLLHANRAVSTDALVDGLWGSERSAGAGKRLQMAITRLRQTLRALDRDGTSVLRTVNGGYLLSIAPGDLDAEVFQSRVLEGQQALQAGDSARARDLVGMALVLWRGPALAEVGFEDFAQPQIRRLEELRLVALETRVDSDLRLGRHAAVVGELGGLVATDPTRERLTGQLMLALYRCGRQADALEVYQRTRAHLAQELGLEPGPALQQLQHQILEHAPSLGAPDEQPGPVTDGGGQHLPDRTWVAVKQAIPPALPTATIGRRGEVDSIGRLLTDCDVRLVTLTGPGGVGKTWVALAVAHAIGTGFPDGLAWVELAAVDRPEDVGGAIVRALAVMPMPGENVAEALLRHLTGRRLLLVIDNFEHVLDAAPLIGQLLSRCSTLTVLTTTRAPLRLAAEHCVAIAPLGVPQDPETATAAELKATDAGALLLAAARRGDRDFEITSTTAPVLARLCARLDGLPLALELAAARLQLVGVEELVAGLDSTTADLGEGPRDAPSRQRTLQATIDWSCRLLDQLEHQAFLCFAVFAGGATPSDAQAVTAASRGTLNALVVQSLIARRRQPDGAMRLSMLETIRQYAAQQLLRHPDHEIIHRTHMQHYLHLVEEAVPNLYTDRAGAAQAVLDREITNVIAAFLWALDAEPASALRLAGLLGKYWYLRDDPEALARLDSALQAAGDTAPGSDRAQAHLYRSIHLGIRHRHGEAQEEAERALALYRQLDDHAGISQALVELGFARGSLGDFERERSCSEEACRHARIAGDEGLLGWTLSRLGAVMGSAIGASVFTQGTELMEQIGDYHRLVVAYNNAAFLALLDDQLEESAELVESARRAADKRGSPRAKAWVLGMSGLVSLFGDNRDRAREAFLQQLRICGEHALRDDAGGGVLGLAALAAADQSDHRAARLCGAAHALGYPPSAYEQPIVDRLNSDYFMAARARHGDHPWQRDERTGAALRWDQAIALALAEFRQNVSENSGTTLRAIDATLATGSSQAQWASGSQRE